jgi:haloalkane dehalogenase
MAGMSGGSVDRPVDAPKVKCLIIAGQRMAYLDAGSGDRTLLMVHGNPVSGHVYRRLIDRLADRYRCIAPDLAGFGSSSKPVGESAYSLPTHISHIAGLVRALDLRNAVLVVHDWGGPIGIGAALQECERYTHLVILNTLTTPVMRIAPVYWLPFHFFMRFGGLFSWLVRQLNFFQWLGVAIMEAEDRRVFLAANSTSDSRAGIAAFPKMIPYRADHPTVPLVSSILDRLHEWDIPSLVLFSDRDSVFAAGEGELLAARLTNAMFREIRGVKHFLQYQAPDEVAAAINEFVDSGRTL